MALSCCDISILLCQIIPLQIKTKEKYRVTSKDCKFNENFSVTRTKEKRLMVVPYCAICGNKKLRFFKNQEVGELLSSVK